MLPNRTIYRFNIEEIVLKMSIVKKYFNKNVDIKFSANDALIE